MKTSKLIITLLLSVNVCALSQNPILNSSKLRDSEEPTVKYSPQDSSTLSQGLKETFTDVDFTKLSETKIGEMFRDLYDKSFYKGNRAITKIRKAGIRESKEKFFAALNNGHSIGESRKTFRTDVNEAYDKAIDKLSRLYEKHSSKGPLLFPGRNRFLTRYYYANETDRTVEALSNGSFTFNTAYQGGSLFTELVAGYLGFLRISFGGMISKSEIQSLTAEEIQVMTEEELTNALQVLKEENDKRLTAQNILAGGGNALVNAATPILHYSSVRKDFLSVISGFGRAGLALPQIGTTSEDATVTMQYGLQFDIWHDLLAETEEGTFALFGKAMVSVFRDETYAKELEINNGFRYVELSGGIEFNTRFRIAMNFPFIYGDNRPAAEGDALKDINTNLLKSSVTVTIIPFK